MGDFKSSPTLENSQALEVSGKIMVVVIIVLFLVVVLFLFFHLYSRRNWSRRDDGSYPSNPRRHFVFAPGQNPVRAMHRGLDRSVIRSLPVLTFHPDEFKDGLECAVCLCELSDGEKARLLPKCNHGFHLDCIDMWLHSHSTCPLCRNPISLETENSSPELSEIPMQGDNSTTGYSTESRNLPTNVLFWGNQTQLNTGDPGLEEGSSSSAPSSSSPVLSMPVGALVIEIPQRLSEPFSSLSPSASRFAEEDLKSPMTTRLRSLRRLLSREKRIIPCSPSSADVEQGQGGRGQSSKTTS